MNEYYPAPQESVVVSSRVRLARNYRDIPFPLMFTKEFADEVIRRARAALPAERYEMFRLSDLTEQEKQYHVEQGHVPTDMGENSAFLLSSGKNVCILINEEDHLRIQVVLPGEQLERCARIAVDCDDALSKVGTIAFDRQLGYLTSSSTNAGTGMRVSLLLHLPALEAANQIGNVTQAVGKLSLSLRSVSTSGVRTQTRMYLLSNQVTLGRTEEDILQSVVDASAEIVQRELDERKISVRENIVCMDRLMRSLGILSQARLLSAAEWEGRVSDLRYASTVGIIPARIAEIDALRRELRPASLRRSAGKELPGRSEDALRAEILRTKMKEWGML